jgi:prepilin-type N-terminal cleavage/methylation domain-containing protein
MNAENIGQFLVPSDTEIDFNDKLLCYGFVAIPLFPSRARSRIPLRPLQRNTLIMRHFSLSRNSRAFSIIELLCVVAVISMMAAAVVPAMSYLGIGDMGRVQTQAIGLLEDARQFAQAHRTYVRVGFADVIGTAGTPNVVMQCIHSSTGDLRNDTATGLADQSLWRSTTRPIVLAGVKFDSALKDRLPSAGSQVSALGLGNFGSFVRRSGDQNVTYQHIVQFDPQGQISIESGALVRFAFIGLSNPRQPSNPVGIVLSGISGRVQLLRQENFNR